MQTQPTTGYPVQAISISLPSGDAGIAKTCQWMRKAANGREGAGSPRIREQALQIIAGVGNRDITGEVTAIYEWVKQNISFRGEWDETIQTPEVTLRWRAGDCDDHAVLLCGLLGSIGYDCRFSTVAVHGEKEFTHVYAEVQDKATGRWIPLDTTMAEAFPGWEPSGVSRKKSWQALGYLARGPAPMRPGTRRMMSRNMRGLGAFNFSADVDTGAGDFSTQFGTSPYPMYVPAGMVGTGYGQPGTYAPPQQYSAGAFVNTPGSTPTWLWPTVIVGGGLLLLVSLRRKGHS